MFSFIDGRETLPRHPTKKFDTRAVSELCGGVLHQTAGGDSAYKCALYHSGPNHVSADGCPGLLYTFFIEMDGTVYWAHDLDKRTWSQGGNGSPVPGTSANGNFLAICLGGDFDGPTHEGKNGHPTFDQFHAALCLWGHLTGRSKDARLPDELWQAVPCPTESLYGHDSFGKANCPGTSGTTLVNAIRHHLVLPEPGATVSEGGTRIETDRDWQLALQKAGFNPGTIDGVWGRNSQAAFCEFQRSRSNLANDGIRGPMSKNELEKAIQ